MQNNSTFKSVNGHYQIPLPGGLEKWDFISSFEGNEAFIHVSSNPIRSITIQWTRDNAAIEDCFAQWKRICYQNNSIKWLQNSEETTKISGQKGIRAKYSVLSSQGKTMFTVCAILKIKDLIYIINVQSSLSLQDADLLFNQSIVKMLINW